MPLFVQLNVNDLPKEYREKYLKHADVWKNHVIQLFYCANSDECGLFKCFIILQIHKYYLFCI